MIDIHAHILPGQDDGSKSLEESAAMAKVAQAEGISKIVACPHVMDASSLERSLSFPHLAAQLEQELSTQGIGVEIVAGAEVQITEGLPQRIRDGYPITLGGGGAYLLLELPFQSLPFFTNQVVFDLLAHRVVPIISHPERVIPIQRDLSLLYRLVEGGALAQINADSLLGLAGPAARDAARLMLRQGLAHFIASDAHSADQRPPSLREAVMLAERLIQPERAWALVRENPLRALAGQTVPSQPLPLEAGMGVRRGFWFWRLFSRPRGQVP